MLRKSSFVDLPVGIFEGVTCFTNDKLYVIYFIFVRWEFSVRFKSFGFFTALLHGCMHLLAVVKLAEIHSRDAAFRFALKGGRLCALLRSYMFCVSETSCSFS